MTFSNLQTWSKVWLVLQKGITFKQTINPTIFVACTEKQNSDKIFLGHLKISINKVSTVNCEMLQLSGHVISFFGHLNFGSKIRIFD